MIVDVSYIAEILPSLLGATLITLRIAVLAFGLSLVIGLGFALLRLSSHRRIAAGTFAITEAIRLTPLLVQLFFAYYVLPEVGISLPAEPTGILVIGLHYATYTSEVFRSGIQAVQRGQWEAAASLGLRGFIVWRKIILPQAIRPMIPALGNYLVQLFKEVPLLSTITVYELLNTANLIAGQSFRYLEVMTLVALIFFVISYGSSLLIAGLESPEQRRR
ncbi:MAG: ectoine/hydroxyectoine ABC transporter permease subunit EhuD [Parvibaculaceae bacterium]